MTGLHSGCRDGIRPLAAEGSGARIVRPGSAGMRLEMRFNHAR